METNSRGRTMIFWFRACRWVTPVPTNYCRYSSWCDYCPPASAPNFPRSLSSPYSPTACSARSVSRSRFAFRTFCGRLAYRYRNFWPVSALSISWFSLFVSFLLLFILVFLLSTRLRPCVVGECAIISHSMRILVADRCIPAWTWVRVILTSSGSSLRLTISITECLSPDSEPVRPDTFSTGPQSYSHSVYFFPKYNVYRT